MEDEEHTNIGYYAIVCSFGGSRSLSFGASPNGFAHYGGKIASDRIAP